MDVEFLPPTAPIAEVVETSSGPVATIDGEEIPTVPQMLFTRIVQPGVLDKHPELADHVGEFWFPDLEETRPKLRVVPICPISNGRQYWPPFSPTNNELLCFSTDGRVPHPNVESPVSDVCGIMDGKKFTPICKKAMWGENKTPPPCRRVISVALFDLDLLVPLRMQFYRTSIPVWNAFLRSLPTSQTVAIIRKQNIADFVLRMETTNKGAYQLLKLRYSPLKDEKPSRFLPLLRWYQKNLVENYFSAGEDLEPPESAETETIDAKSEEQALAAEESAESDGFSMG